MTILLGENLKKYFGEVRAVDDVNIKLSSGEILSIIGSNGAGKTTLINLLSGMFIPDSGKIYFRDKDVTTMSPYKKAKIGIARSFQLVTLFDNLTVLDNVRCSIFARVGKTKNIFSLVERDADVKQEALTILSSMGLIDRKEVLAKDLPHPLRKLLDIALALAQKPKVLFLDEPTSGISSDEKDNVMKAIISAIKPKKIATVVVEHDLDIVADYTTKTLAMHGGKIIAQGKPKEVMENPKVKLAV